MAEKWPILPGRATNIAVLELVPIVVSAFLWGHLWCRKKMLIHTDNMSVVYAINKFLPRDPHLVMLLKMLAKLSIQGHFWIKAVHIRGKDNGRADALSRGDLASFRRLTPGASVSPVRVDPEFLESCLVFNKTL